MKLPTNIKVTCYANGNQLKGMFASLELKTRRKNAFHVIAGPANSKGIAEVVWTQVEESAYRDVSLFPMDYTGIADFTGELLVIPMNREGIRQALKGYEEWGEFIEFPADYADQLHEAIRILEEIAPAQLSVEVEHDGEGITIYTETVQA